MLSKDEKQFVQYWEANRLRKKKVVRQLSVGLPLSTAIIMAIFATTFSGWYGEAMRVMKTEKTSLFIVLIGAAILITVFMVIYSAKHRWDLNEQHYNELLSRQKED